jgi:predicted AAA+ superfamily ATPase
MEDVIQQFEKDLKAYLDNTFNTYNEQDEIKKLDDIEKTVNDYVDNYLLETNLIAGDVALSVQHIVDEFIRSKIK